MKSISSTKLLGAVDRSNLRWLSTSVIFLTRHGSHAYGTSTPTSDEDFKGVAIPPLKYYFGYLEQFQQAEFRHQVDGIDAVLYDVRKFFKMAADCNPSIIEVLFTDPSDHLVMTDFGKKLIDNRESFISKKAKHTFSGYAVSQLKKIKTHKKWISNPPTVKPERADFDLPERTVIPADQLAAAQSIIRKQIASWNVPIDELDDAARIAVQERFAEALALIETGARAQLLATLEHNLDFKTQLPLLPVEICEGYKIAIEDVRAQPGANLERIAGQLQGFDDNFLEHLDREKRYKTKMEEWRNYQNWLQTRNAARSELERKFGYDTKHGMHLVRLVRMGEEILQGKGVLVKRPDAEELLSIRYGAWKYDDLLEWSEKKLASLDELYETTKIPNAPDRVKLDYLCQELVSDHLSEQMVTHRRSYGAQGQ